MFVYLTNTDGLTRLINLSKIETVYNDSVKFTVDSMKVDGGNLTYTIVDKIIHKKNAPSYCIAYKGSVIKGII